MTDWTTRLLQAMQAGTSLTLGEQPLAGNGTALALAPHPDDPDAAGVLQRALMRGGWRLEWVIVASGWSGVEATEAIETATKIALREEEQRAAAQHFGLPDDRLTFLRLDETPATGKIIDDAANRDRLFACLDVAQPDLVILPHGEDTHPDHRLVYRWLGEWAQAQAARTIVLGNEDPKTVTLRPDFLFTFGESTAAWKAELLECHHSQSLRNQRTRGITFARRILETNVQAEGYAERFQAAVYPTK